MLLQDLRTPDATKRKCIGDKIGVGRGKGVSAGGRHADIWIAGTSLNWTGLEPVIEVAFLNGVQTPVLEQETNFRTDGLSWKVVHKYGVGAVGWRGAAFNPGE